MYEIEVILFPYSTFLENYFPPNGIYAHNNFVGAIENTREKLDLVLFPKNLNLIETIEPLSDNCYLSSLAADLNFSIVDPEMRQPETWFSVKQVQ